MKSEILDKKDEKIEWIVVLRALACLAVIMLHVIDGWTATAGIEIIDAHISGGGGKMDY